MLALGVNVDHVATLRQARGTAYPSPLEAARLAAKGGAEGITIHLREDRRHIQDTDVWEMRREQELPLNLEMGIAPDIVELAFEVIPDEVCLVPEKREELTTEGGLDVCGQMGKLEPLCKRFHDAGIKVSLFIDPDPDQVRAAAELEVPLIELHTGTFCEEEGDARLECLRQLTEGAVMAHQFGIQVNAGHGLNLDNLADLAPCPYLHTLNIGHSIVARSVFVGMEEAVAEMLRAMQACRIS